jgi:hypothetical protein
MPLRDNSGMNSSNTKYKRHRFPAEIIQHSVWLYYRFSLSHRDIEDMLAERGITVSYEAIRMWCNKFGPQYARRLKRRQQGFGDTFFIVKNHIIKMIQYEVSDEKATKIPPSGIQTRSSGAGGEACSKAQS